jgi:hypothetical protein
MAISGGRSYKSSEDNSNDRPILQPAKNHWQLDQESIISCSATYLVYL